jgi:hypothetical protein
MATVSLRVPDGLKEQMDEHSDINWSAVIRSHIEDELSELDSRNVGHAVAVSERLSNAVDDEAVAEQNTAETIRAWRERRYGGE